MVIREIKDFGGPCLSRLTGLSFPDGRPRYRGRKRSITSAICCGSAPGPWRGDSPLVAQPDLVEVLAQEYRKAARHHAEQGDFRRAAYIYGFLLRDDRKAAGVLQRGGLHHDAAMLYLMKLNDVAAAAQAFEAEG